MELASIERKSCPHIRRSSQLAAYLAREELGAADFDELVGLSFDEYHGTSASRWDEAEDERTERARIKNKRSSSLYHDPRYKGMQNSTGHHKKRQRKKRREGADVLFFSKQEKDLRSDQQRARTEEIVKTVTFGLDRRQVRELDLSEYLDTLTDTMLFELGELLLNVKKLVIRKWNKVSIAGLRSVALGFGDRLEEVDFSDSPMTDEMITMLMSRLFSMKAAKLKRCTLLSNSCARALAEATSLTLVSLDLSECPLISEDALMWLGGQNGPSSVPCARLRSLSVAHCTKVRDKGLIAIGKGCKSLKFLNLAGCNQITDRGIEGLVANGCRLQVLNVSGCHLLGNRAIENLGRTVSDSIRSLNLSRCARITDEGLQFLGQASKLQALNLAGCMKISELGIFYIVNRNKAIQTLNVNGCELISERGLSEMLRALDFVELAKSYTGFKPKEKAQKLKIAAQEHVVQNNASKIISAVLRGHATRLRLARERLDALRQKSALEIQCWYRARLAKTMYVGVLLQRRRKEAATRIQQWWRNRLGRLIYLLQRRKAELETKQAIYAVKIQAAFRGKRARDCNPDVPAAIAMMKELRQAEVESAVVVRLQSIARRKISHTLFSSKREELLQRSRDIHFAAIKIQCIIRQKLARLLALRKLQWYKRKFARQIRAATQIERIARGKIARRILRDLQRAKEEELAQMECAAAMLQGMYRGMQGRRYFMLMKEIRRRQIKAAIKIQRIYRGSCVPHWSKIKLERAKEHILTRAQELHEEAHQSIQKRIQLREMCLERDSASEDEHIRELGGYIEEDESDDWQEHWDENLQRPFYFSPSRNQRTYEPYGDSSFEIALIEKNVRVQDEFTGYWRLGVITKYNTKKRKHRIEYLEDGDLDHEWIRLKEDEGRVQVFDTESESWGMLRHLRIAYQQLQKALKEEIDALNASLSSSLSASNTDWDNVNVDGLDPSLSENYTSETLPWAEPDQASTSFEEGTTSLEPSFPGYETHFDTESGMYYYYNVETGESSWTPPETSYYE